MGAVIFITLGFCKIAAKNEVLCCKTVKTKEGRFNLMTSIML